MQAILLRLGKGNRWWAAEIVLRAFGAALLGICAAASWWLRRSVAQPPAHAATLLEFALAVLIVASFGLGLAFLFEGPGLFRLIPVPGRHGQFTL